MTTIFPKSLTDIAEETLETCRGSGLMLAVAESCTGGLVAACLTSLAGSSAVVERGFVTYTNRSKQDMLGVPPHLFTTVGAVSEDVARAMAEGALERSQAHVSVSVTGIAGPGGATAGKPVGLVHMASARKGRDTLHERHVFSGDRDAVRRQATEAALRLLLRQVGE
ncbi:MAG: damage-inducible protein CinA [Rhodospirillales bacterium RIFCSPLOWO2_12_FULL_67_15]|nr:MAG: damage-inducible protein CinA [Rhodospirillales bacterium RIFCSPLOWO2_12_FULL_67_15]